MASCALENNSDDNKKIASLLLLDSYWLIAMFSVTINIMITSGQELYTKLRPMCYTLLVNKIRGILCWKAFTG